MESNLRYIFAADVLLNKPDAKLILADLLEDQGDIALATRARGKISTSQKRLDFVISIIPWSVAIQMTTVMVQHAFEGLSHRRINRAMQIIFNWIQDDSDSIEDGLSELSSFVPPSDFHFRNHMERIAGSMHAATSLAMMIVENLHDNEVNKRHLIQQCVDHLRKSIKAAREVARGKWVSGKMTGGVRRWHDNLQKVEKMKNDEIRWQVEFCVSELMKLSKQQ